MQKSNKNQPDDDDLPPELEDLPDELLGKKTNKTVGGGNIKYGDFAEVKEEKPIDQALIQAEQPKKQASSGLKKGFFNSEPKTSTKKSSEQKAPEPELIKPTNKKAPGVIDEVQNAMKPNANLGPKGQEWMTPDLLNKIGANPKLMKLFTNAEYMQAFSMMQTKPREVMQKYGNNEEFQELFKEFGKVMGGHFETLSNQVDEKKAQEDKEIEQQKKLQKTIDSDSEVKDILSDQKVQAFLQFLQQNQKVDFNQVLAKDPQLAAKIKKLIDKGVLNVQAQ